MVPSAASAAMPVATCSAICAGPLPSITQAMEGDGLVGLWGATNTAPSGLSAAVTWSAENGSAMGAPSVNGPEAAAGGAVVGVGGRRGRRAVLRGGRVGVGEPEPQAASSSASGARLINPNCSR